MANKQKITTFLWFDNNAEQAMEFYTAIFKHSKILSVSRYGEAGPGPKGTVMVGTFELEGPALPSLEWRPTLQIRGGDLAGDRLRDAGGDRLFLREKLAPAGRRRRAG